MVVSFPFLVLAFSHRQVCHLQCSQLHTSLLDVVGQYEGHPVSAKFFFNKLQKFAFVMSEGCGLT